MIRFFTLCTVILLPLTLYAEPFTNGLDLMEGDITTQEFASEEPIPTTFEEGPAYDAPTTGSDRGAIQIKKETIIRYECAREAAVAVTNTLVVAWGVSAFDEIIRLYTRDGFDSYIIKEVSDEAKVLAEFENAIKASGAQIVILSMHGALCFDFNDETVGYLFPGAVPDPYFEETNTQYHSCEAFEENTDGIETTKFLEILSRIAQMAIVDACQQVANDDTGFPVLLSGDQCNATMDGMISAIRHATGNCEKYDTDEDGYISPVELFALQELYLEPIKGPDGEIIGYKNEWALNRCAIDYFADNGDSAQGFRCR
jgi:hypothetical protein